jgi:Invasion associated locus B (IalB) protein
VPGFAPHGESLARGRAAHQARCDAAAVAFRCGCRYGDAMSRIRFHPAGALAAAIMLAAMPAARAATHKAHDAGHQASDAATKATGMLGSAGAWSAYASADQTGRVCFLVGHPQKSEGVGVGRKEVMAMVTHRPAEHISNVVSFVEGYPLKEGSDVNLEVGDRKFELFTKDDSAWARTSELDRTIVATLAKGSKAVVKGEPQKGRPTIDIYSLSGFDRALALIDKACGIKRESAAAKPHKPAHHRHHPAHPTHKAHKEPG